MPSAQKMMAKANHVWNHENIHKLDHRWFKDPYEPESDRRGHKEWDSYLQEHIADNEFDREILDDVPEGMREMIRALFHFNLKRERPYQIQFAWLPNYDWELQVVECPPTSVSPGGITLIIKGRYPLDGPHPSRIKKPKKKGKKGKKHKKGD